MKKDLLVQLIALVIIIIGTAIVILDGVENNIVPEALKGKGMYFVVVGLFTSSIYSLVTNAKKKKDD